MLPHLHGRSTFLTQILRLRMLRRTHAGCAKQILPKAAASLCSENELIVALTKNLNAEKQLALFCDYDGTLASMKIPTQQRNLCPDVLNLLCKLSQCQQIPCLCVISGRSIQNLKKVVPVKGSYYSGNHGMEIEFPNGKRHDYKLTKEMKANHKKLLKHLEENYAKDNAWVEDKHASLSYHYAEGVTKSAKEKLKAELSKIIEAHSMRPTFSHESLDARMPVDWHKGDAANFTLCKVFGENWQNCVQAVFIGDDNTDEDAMKTLKRRGLSFRISADPELKTYADYRIPQQNLIGVFLQTIANIYNC